jgi:hypothetical protein
MEPPDDVLAAVGRLALEAAWLEAVVASIAEPLYQDALPLLAQGGAHPFTKARDVAHKIPDRTLRTRTLDWIDTAAEMVQKARNPIVHGLIHVDPSTGQWQVLHPRSGDVITLDAGRLGLQWKAVEQHVANGFDLPPLIHGSKATGKGGSTPKPPANT